jgi:hypothetical protein
LSYPPPHLAIYGAFLLILMVYWPQLDEKLSVKSKIFFDLGVNSFNLTYLIYDDLAAGIRIKYPSGWNVLEQLGNVSGNSILVDFYHTGTNGTNGYSENANVIVSSRSGYPINSVEKSESTVKRAIQPTMVTPATSADGSASTEQLNEFTNLTIKDLRETLSNFALLESESTIVSGLPAHKITYTMSGNQSQVKQMQARTSTEDRWFVITYSAEPSAYFQPRTAENILKTLLIR